MTDYLEECLENAGALLEEVRRVEESLAAPLWREQAESGRALQDSLRRSDFPEEESETPAEKTGLEVSPSGRTGERPSDLPERKARAPEALLEPLERGDRELERPLLEQLERMERAVLSAERAGSPEQGASPIGEDGSWGRFPVSLSTPGGGSLPGGVEESVSGWPSGLGTESLTPGAAAEDWAERADRAFRRDSRRYDGGFYLY